MAETVTVVYNGPHAAVDIHDPNDGSSIATEVARGDSIEVPKHVGESLVESGNFKAAKQPEPAQAQKVSNDTDVPQAQKDGK